MYTTLIINDEQSVHTAIRSLVDWDGMRMARPESACNGVEALAHGKFFADDGDSLVRLTVFAAHSGSFAAEQHGNACLLQLVQTFERITFENTGARQNDRGIRAVTVTEPAVTDLALTEDFSVDVVKIDLSVQ